MRPDDQPPATSGSNPQPELGGRRWTEVALVALLAIVAAAYGWFVTRSFGPGLTNDSTAYLDVARSLQAGDGLRMWLEDPLVTWPFLYPLLLASISSTVGIDLFDAGRVLAAIATVVLAFASWGVVRRSVATAWIRVAAVATVLFGGAMVTVATRLLTDQLFAVGTVVFLLVVLVAVDTGRLRWVGAAVAVSSVLFTTRYVGAVLVPVGVVLLACFPSRRARAQRLRGAALLAVGGVAVPVAYALRNRSVSGSAFSQNVSTNAGSALSFSNVPSSTSTWVVGQTGDNPLYGVLGIAGLLVVIAAAVLLVAAERQAGRPTASDPVVADRAVVGAAWLTLFALVLALRVVVAFDLDDRTMAMLFAPAVFVLAATVDARCSGVDAGATSRVRRPAVVGLGAFVLWVVVSVALGARHGELVNRNGAALANAGWRPTLDELELREVASDLPPGCDVRSNQPGLLYLAGVETDLMPGASTTPDPEPGTPLCVIWAHRAVGPDEAKSLDGVIERFGLEQTVAAETYAVYVAR